MTPTAELEEAVIISGSRRGKYVRIRPDNSVLEEIDRPTPLASDKSVTDRLNDLNQRVALLEGFRDLSLEFLRRNVDRLREEAERDAKVPSSQD